MPVDVRVETTIAKPRAAVAAIMFDPKNDAAWTSGVIAVTPLTPGRLRAGSRVERKVHFMGRTFGYEYRVTAADADRFVEMEVDKPFPMKIRYELEDAGGATVARIHARGDASGFFRIGGPLLKWMVRRNIAKDLAGLKRIVERGIA
jgi:carbon monoxide dehydrogenase subunit G